MARYLSLKDFLAAHAKGETPKKTRVINWTVNDSVTIEAQVRGKRVVLYEAETCNGFMHEFAAAMGLEGVTS